MDFDARTVSEVATAGIKLIVDPRLIIEIVVPGNSNEIFRRTIIIRKSSLAVIFLRARSYFNHNLFETGIKTEIIGILSCLRHGREFLTNK